MFNTQYINEMENPRVQKYRLDLQDYRFVVRWIKGEQNIAADALSRAPVGDPCAVEDCFNCLKLLVQSRNSQCQGCL